MNVSEFIYNMLLRQFSIQTSNINNDMKLRELGLDSFDIFAFVSELENWMEYKIPDADLVSFERLQDVICYVEKRQMKAGDIN